MNQPTLFDEEPVIFSSFKKRKAALEKAVRAVVKTREEN